jgi:hypothetical protein
MTLLSAAEDFAYKTLPALPGVLGKLRYVSGLRQADGRYEHWGLVRVYGEQAVQQVLGDKHRDLMMQVLRLPLRELVADAIECAEHEEASPADYVALLTEDAKKLIPENVGGGSAHHFRTVLQTLSGLIRSHKDANRLVS